jgi:DNA-binding Lrp family transcriptional regulator
VYVSNLENSLLSRQQNSSGDRIEFFESSENKSDKASVYNCLLQLDESSLKILEIAGKKPNIKSQALKEEVNLSTAPVLGRTKKLEALGVLVRTVVPGTERRKMPALMVSLPSNVSMAAIECARQRMSLEEYLRLEGVEKEFSSVSLPPLNAADCDGKVDQASTSLERMGEVLNAAVEKIIELEERLIRVEQALQNDSFDRDKCLAVLRSKR